MSCNTATKVRPQGKIGTWGQVFPTEKLTAQKSTLFVKKLLAIAVSNIIYLRAIFPEHAFGDRCLEDLNLKILRDNSTCHSACQVIKWVRGCFDALDKKYLKMMMIGMCANEEDPDTVIESYTFKFSYAENAGIDIYRNNKKITSANTESEIKKATMRLLHTLVVLTQSLHSLPDNIMMTMKLLYYDDVTPPEYEPPGFQAAEVDNFNFGTEEPMNIKVGDVTTPFHTVKLQIKTDGKQFDLDNKDDANENVPTTAVPQNVCDGGLDSDDDEQMDTTDVVPEAPIRQVTSSLDEMQVVPEPCEADSAPATTPSKPGLDGQATTVIDVNSQVSNMEESNNDDYGISCGCGCNEDDGLMILCAHCKNWQHAVCYGIIQDSEAPERHICQNCANPNDPSALPTDPYLSTLQHVALQATCLWRRSLLACTEMSRVLAPCLARRLGVEMTVAQGLISRLEKEGYLKPATKGKRLGKVVNKSKLTNEGLKKYFKKAEGVDQLVKQAKELEISDTNTNKQKQDENIEPKKAPWTQGRRRKIVKSISNADHQFEVCNSQELSQEVEPSRKRRKSSTAQQPLILPNSSQN